MPYWAEYCYKGEEYSKDYAYKECPDCQRIICEQNLSNGYVYQFKTIPVYGDCDDEICSQCYEEHMKEFGADIDVMLAKRRIAGSFYSNTELREAGFEESQEINSYLVGAGRNGYAPEENFFSKIKQLKNSGYFSERIALFDYDSMAIGGLGGYVTMWTKLKAY